MMESSSNLKLVKLLTGIYGCNISLFSTYKIGEIEIEQ